MKKKLFFICAAAIVILSAVNVNLAFNNDSNVKLSLTSIMAIAKGETFICSVCGAPVDECGCGAVITCNDGSCHGETCHEFTYNWYCPCSANGDPSFICPL